MNNYYNQFFCKQDNRFSVLIEDNGIVAYAYLLRDKNIIGDVWLYNHLETPETVDWKDNTKMPYLNPSQFTLNDKVNQPIDISSDIVLNWIVSESIIFVKISLLNGLIVILKSDTYPGWSNNVIKDGPLAQRLTEIQNLELIINALQGNLKGRKLSSNEESKLNLMFNKIPFIKKIIFFGITYNLIGQTFYLDEENDLSEIGVKMQWLTPDEQIEEAFKFMPGMAAIKNNYLPIGKCLEGSGDPYFIKELGEILYLYRIPHDVAISNDSLLESQIEAICDLNSFFKFSQLPQLLPHM